jgi:iron complex transport system ATP-binding protein
MPVLEAREVTVRRAGRALLEAASVALEASQLTAVVGPNGSGKSTLLRALGGLWPCAEGVVLLDGRSVRELPRREVARRVSFLPQDTRCDFAFTAVEVVSMGRHPHRGRFDRARARDGAAVEEAMRRCDVLALRERTLDTLSGGERQRVAIARCLATEPAVLLLDEPTAHLDLSHALALLDLCRSLAASGQAVGFATHDLDQAARYATQVVVLQMGRVRHHGRPEEALTPNACRAVFDVDAEVATTARGRSVFVFGTSRKEQAS